MSRISTILAICLLAAASPVAFAEGGAQVAPEPAPEDAPRNAGESAVGEAAAAIDAAEALALNPLSALDKATLDGFRDAPLFTPSRTRPVPPPPPAVAEAPPPPPPAEEAPADPPTLTLLGIAEGPEGAVAFVKKDGEEDPEQLRLGDQVDSWLVSAIEPQAMKLTLDDREQEYRMFVRTEGGASAESSDDGDSGDDSSSSGDQSSSDDDDDQDNAVETQRPATQRSGSEREMEAARKAQQNARKRARDGASVPEGN